VRLASDQKPTSDVISTVQWAFAGQSSIALGVVGRGAFVELWDFGPAGVWAWFD
jgi:hypothetical protein